MTTQQVEAASPVVLFREVFGMKPAQTLSEFINEVKPLREDVGFVNEVRAYALKNATA